MTIRLTRLLVHKNAGRWYVRARLEYDGLTEYRTMYGPFDTSDAAHDIARREVRWQRHRSASQTSQ